MVYYFRHDCNLLTNNNMCLLASCSWKYRTAYDELLQMIVVQTVSKQSISYNNYAKFNLLLYEIANLIKNII